jgi:hypothetical protein
MQNKGGCSKSYRSTLPVLEGWLITFTVAARRHVDCSNTEVSGSDPSRGSKVRVFLRHSDLPRGRQIGRKTTAAMRVQDPLRLN